MDPLMYKYVTVIILCAINLLNYMDRFTVAGILTTLEQKTNCKSCPCSHETHHYKNHSAGDCVSERNCLANQSHDSSSGTCWCCCGLGIDDEEGGLLTTIFIVSYTILSPVFGYCGDRYSRPRLMALGIFIWSGFTLAGSFFKVYWAFLLMRSFVGIGEASYGTIAPTIIADLFHVDRRMRMLSIFYLTTPVGSALGYVVGSSVSALFNCWQWAFRVTPVFGVILAFLCWCVVQEPPRGHSDVNSESGLTQTLKGASGAKVFISDVITIIKCKTFFWSTLGFSCMSFVVGALTQWAPSFIIWATKVAYGVPNGYSQRKASIIFGAITVVTGIFGVVVGGEWAKRWGKTNPRADAYVCAIGLLASAPFLYFALLYAHRVPSLFWALSVFAEVLLCLEWAPVAAILLYVIVPQRRSTAEAIQILFIHLLGDAFSPLIIGKLADTLRGTSLPPDVKSDTVSLYDAEKEYFALQHALFMTAFVAVLGGFCFLITSFYLERDRDAATQLIKIQDKSGLDNTAINDPSEESNRDESDRLLIGARCT